MRYLPAAGMVISMRLIVLTMITVCVVSLCVEIGVMSEGPGVWLNGVAAIVTAIAYLAETHRTSSAVADLTIRVSKLEAMS